MNLHPKRYKIYQQDRKGSKLAASASYNATLQQGTIFDSKTYIWSHEIKNIWKDVKYPRRTLFHSVQEYFLIIQLARGAQKMLYSIGISQTQFSRLTSRGVREKDAPPHRALHVTD